LSLDKFADLWSPGVQLAERLRSSVTNDTIVLAIANGGVPAAGVVAQQLGLPVDVVVIKRLFAPNGAAFPICATSVAGSLVRDDLPPQMSEIAAVPNFVDSSLRELGNREYACRDGKPSVDIRGKNVILVDNGVHTGSTMLCAIRAVRKLEAFRIVAAVPVIATESREGIEAAADEFIYLRATENFGHVGLWYSDFTKPSNEVIRETLTNSTTRFASKN